jgi:transposase
MPTLRRILGVLDGNIKKRKELTPKKRGAIVGARLCGVPATKVANILKVPITTVYSTVKADLLRDEGNTRKRTGRPIKYTDREVRALVRYVRRNPKDTYQQVRNAFGWKYANHTLQRMLEPSGITNWRCRRQPFLTEKTACLRYNWCRARKHWTFDDFAKHMWSDEYSAERGKGGVREWVFCTAAERLLLANVTTYKKSKDISVMVWACFWWKDGAIHKSDLYIIDRDFESKKHRYSANSYLEVLDFNIEGCWEPGLVFIQDNTPIHNAYKVRQWFADRAIPVLE